MARQPAHANKLDLGLMQAVKKQDYTLVVEHVARGADVNSRDVRYKCPLFQAATTGNLEIMRHLLSRGADPNLLDGGKTPLMEAVYRGHREAIDMLTQAGANVFAKLEIHAGVFMDVPQFALEAGNKQLAAELRSLINQQERIEGGTRLRLKDVADQLNLDEQGKP